MSVLRSFLAVALLASTSLLSHASLINGSFESGLTGWTVSKSGSFGSGTSPANVTDGTTSARMWSYTSCATSGCGAFSYTAGNYIGLAQTFDMSGINDIYFDAYLGGAPNPGTSYQSFMTAAAYIGATQVWNSQAIGQYLDINIDVSALVGLQTLEFRIEAIGNGVDAKSDHLYIDNVRAPSAVPEPATLGLFGLGLAALGFARRKA
ncbi:PEP-CTERM sorting domain-containing protein [Dasania sp. GY-MA-18]|uniref:PEP-CTERM sorting domain-containing protein n=1 Tax=Dasania phycosphaerae TaxID=2950436 RepID=A0A9J6RPW0_9GAMM|nr:MULTISPECIES: PEP-CTERM sorting domain-containing protein [Dasania]MCR8924030.1 PEP-CTERM sorting domain-containing protein [Dasania sp. GY-MA-18]MCZ0866603.1 PEP-CTERM sorting domain-containing protein [Dasania phycosphaerae]MCZ0870188.1 PEP-CTERM sorting domain-containing protein [Dasania phycosphaerae]